jgi:hypothetical protein
VALSWRLRDGALLSARLLLRRDGRVDATLELPGDAARGIASLLVPASRDPGPAVLSAEELLLHVRARPAGGLDLAALVPQGSQADRMFRLKSELFRGIVLDGTWEAAVYLPGAGEPAPRAALALGFTQRAAAAAAMEAFVSELRDTWSLRRSLFSVGEARGACLLDLRLLPGFAPCYVVDERALVVGFNPASIRRALDGEPAPLGSAGTGAVVELARFAEADARLAAAAGAEPQQASRRSPWQRLRAEGSRDGDTVRVQITLEPEADT